ncbi:hypothetical protein PCC9214_04226 [Planktothrix tepida]|uniref:Uncharacterized protein n=1 Tax=Planktothrix pseudagardhii TaxID=132604 RepID=A0A9W4G3F0_9CYAN|nr:hypothetical protein NO713_01419 [Planktothrix pseudagardhii]CAD5976747.1 hypothetical protein PCC9214_04226 [Planktothrix tepida]
MEIKIYWGEILKISYQLSVISLGFKYLVEIVTDKTLTSYPLLISPQKQTLT